MAHKRQQDDEPVKWSSYVLYLARWYLFAVAALLILYFLLYTIEHSKTTVVITRSYRVPVEQPEKEEETDGDG